jgi:hypothetical protein
MSHLDDKILPLIDQMLLTHLFGSWNLCQDAISRVMLLVNGVQPPNRCTAAANFYPKAICRISETGIVVDQFLF